MAKINNFTGAGVSSAIAIAVIPYIKNPAPTLTLEKK
jgi:hypothetical protein